MKKAILITYDGTEIPVHATTEHPASSYGKAVWVDDDNNAYMQVGLEMLVPQYRITNVTDE